MRKKSYIAIKKEIEEMKGKGFAEETIVSVLRAKYNESSIERIYTEAQWERENEQADQVDEKANDKYNKIAIIAGGAITVFIVFIFIVVMSYMGDRENSVTDSYTPTKRDAYYMSQQLLKKKLKAPSTASFPRYQEGMYVEEIGDNEYLITAYVDAENSFGAKLRNTYMSQVKYLYGETWQDLGTYLIE